MGVQDITSKNMEKMGNYIKWKHMESAAEYGNCKNMQRIEYDGNWIHMVNMVIYEI